MFPLSLKRRIINHRVAVRAGSVFFVLGSGQARRRVFFLLRQSVCFAGVYLADIFLHTGVEVISDTNGNRYEDPWKDREPAPRFIVTLLSRRFKQRISASAAFRISRKIAEATVAAFDRVHEYDL